jgi:two-component system, OmpR family, phosphate regulon response regulator PhoB
MAKKILIIEDDKFLRKIIKRKFSGEGFDVIEAVDGERGITLAKNDQPDIIILDLVLPEINGFEVLQTLKQTPETSEIPVIILSNLGEEENVKKGLAAGAADYLIKSNLDPSDIFDRVGKVLALNKGR